MAPPAFSELGEACRDIFDKGYNYGFYTVDAKTKTDKNVEFKANISSSRDTGKVTGELESEYKWTEYGLTLTEKWNTDNVLNTEVKFEDQIAEGVEVGFEVSFAPQTGEKGATLKGAYKTDFLNFNADVGVDLEGPPINAAAVLGYEGWLAGYELSFDTAESKLTSSNFGFGYAAEDFSFTTLVNEGQEFSGFVHHKVNDKLEAAVNLSWAAENGNTSFGVGGKYSLDEDSSISAKINNETHIGLGYTQKLREGVKLIVSTLIDAKNINQGGHKIGLGLEFEA